LQFGEWPLLELGPTQIFSRTDADGALESLLSTDNMRIEIDSQWGTGLSHRHYVDL
jgi:hypothetical protein